MGGGPPCFPQGFTCPVVLWITTRILFVSSTGLSPSMVGLSRPLRLQNSSLCVVSSTPIKETFIGLGFSPFARRYLGNRVFFLFLRVLRCFSSPGLPSSAYLFSSRYLEFALGGFPHSDIPGSKSTCDSPRRFGAYPVLHRLLVPRHSPYALNNLTSKIVII